MTFSSKPAAGSGAAASSAIVVREVVGSHVLTIDGYSRTKALLSEQFYSQTFTAAGHRWCIRYYPCGKWYGLVDWISMYLQLERSCHGRDVKARFTISLLDSTGHEVPSYSFDSQWTHKFTSKGEEEGFPKFIKRKKLERSNYLKGDCFKVRCSITVFDEVHTQDSPAPALAPAPAPTLAPAKFVVVPPPVDMKKLHLGHIKKEADDAAPERFVVVPPADMQKHLGDLLSSGEGADVTLEVDGETFRAHKIILAARSPVFKAELFGPKEEGTSTCVLVKDMEARVFKALLHFIYTDSLPDVEKGETMVMAQSLLAAADRYGMERLKLICEEKLCNYIDTSSVGTILALAEQHGWVGLKKACLKFLMTGSNLKAAIVTDGFDHLTNSCPSVLKEFLTKLTM